MGRVRAYLRRNALALVALFIALSGAAWAAGLPRDSVSSRQLVDNAVKSRDVKDNGLRGPDVRESSLEQVPSAASADDAGRLGGNPASAYLRFDSATIPSGTTSFGAWRVVDEVVGSPDLYEFETVSRPGRAPAPILAPSVNFAPGTAGGADNDDSCSGAVTAPTAPAGKVCLYLSESQNVDALGGYAVSNVGADNVFGFTVRATASSAGLVNADGSWAYTAP